MTKRMSVLSRQNYSATQIIAIQSLFKDFVDNTQKVQKIKEKTNTTWKKNPDNC